MTTFPNFDKLSEARILALLLTGLPCRTFSKAMAAHLCLPSPVVRDWVGNTVGPTRHYLPLLICSDELPRPAR